MWILTAAYSPIIQSISQMQSILASAMYPQAILTTRMQDMLNTLLIPIHEMQYSVNVSIANSIANSLTANDFVIQDLTKDIQKNLVNFSSHISTAFSSILENISFHQEYVEVPEYLYSLTIHENEYPQEIPLTVETHSPKRRITLEFLFKLYITEYNCFIQRVADHLLSQHRCIFSKYLCTS